MKRLHIILAAVACFAVIGTTAAFAAEFDIPIDTVVRAPEGSYTVLADVETPEDLVGSSCVSIAVAGNQESVHPNNDLIIETGDTTVTLKDVEREPGVSTPAAGEVTLGERVKVTLHMGADEVFSGGIVIVIGSNCTPPTPPTTEPPGVPAIAIEKQVWDIAAQAWADDALYELTETSAKWRITVTNSGESDLTNVYTTDVESLGMYDTSDCERTLGDMAVGESSQYECTIGAITSGEPFENTATAIGTGPNEEQVTATDSANLGWVGGVTITQPPTTVAPTTAPTTTLAPEETLPVTGPADDQLRGFTMAGAVLLVGGIVLLAGASLIGRIRLED
ncbi:MAG: DUF7617 domain-containing protein [Acidimicrobiia bacterium]